MPTEDNINQLYEELDILESRISQLESNTTQRGEYFKSIIEQIEEPKCCSPCDNGGENPPVISCEGATYSITLESLYPIINDTENTVIATVKRGGEIRNHEFQYVDGGSVFGDFWNSYFNDWVELVTSDYATFFNKVAEHVEVSIQSARLLNPPYPYQPEFAEVNPTYKIIDGVISFCLSERFI